MLTGVFELCRQTARVTAWQGDGKTIFLATARLLRVSGMVTTDDRMPAAARHLNIPTLP